jgi:hypothetical protein
MKTVNLPCERMRSAVGLAIAGTGIFRLFTQIMDVSEQITRTLDQSSAARMQLLSWIMVASTLNAHSLGHDLLRIFWPLFPSVAGSILLWSAASRGSKRNRRPCTQWA